MISVLDTAWNMGINGGCEPSSADVQELSDKYAKLGVVLNEMNRAMGLLDFVPEILTPAVVTKLTYVPDLLRAARIPAPKVEVPSE